MTVQSVDQLTQKKCKPCEGGVDPHVLLAVRRGARGTWQPMHRDYEAEVGDVAAAALFEAERAAALKALARLGWEPLPPDEGGDEDGGDANRLSEPAGKPSGA